MTEKRIAANKRNALLSTGPRTPEGKRKASLNALKHGLRSVSMALPILEAPEDWEAHRSQTVRDLGASGYVETVLAERAAALLWRLGRVTRYETEVVSIAMMKEAAGTHYMNKETVTSLKETLDYLEEREALVRRVRGLKGKARVSGLDAALVLEKVADALDVELFPEDGREPVSLDLPGFPEDPEVCWETFDGWTRDLVEAGVQAIKALAVDASSFALTDPWSWTLSYVMREANEARTRYEERAAEADRGVRKALLPEDKTLDKLSRYEAHLERGLFRTLHELERLQASRSGAALPPPAALDVDVSVSEAS